VLAEVGLALAPPRHFLLFLVSTVKLRTL
jgi:hypothetical protein